MENKNRSAVKVADRELVIERIIDAPREQVWKAWSEPERIKLWWGPKDFTAPSIKTDFRVRGTYLFCMRSPEGKDYWSTGTYREIVPQKRIVFSDSFADERGKVVPATYYGMNADLPLELEVIITLEDQAGKTRLTLTHRGFQPGEDFEMARSGWNESFDKLARILK